MIFCRNKIHHRGHLQLSKLHPNPIKSSQAGVQIWVDTKIFRHERSLGLMVPRYNHQPPLPQTFPRKPTRYSHILINGQTVLLAPLNYPQHVGCVFCTRTAGVITSVDIASPANTTSSSIWRHIRSAFAQYFVFLIKVEEKLYWGPTKVIEQDQQCVIWVALFDINTYAMQIEHLFQLVEHSRTVLKVGDKSSQLICN